MSEKTGISWCDSTINFWSGCTKVSAGCKNCYAEARDARMMQEKVVHFGEGAPRLKHVGAVKNALAMNRKPWICDGCGNAFASENRPDWCCDGMFHRRRIFSLSLGDWLDDEVPIEWLAEMLDTIRHCDQVVWILCTKRPENWNMRAYAAMDKANSDTAWWLQSWAEGNAIPKNIILLTSVENQEQADKRIPELLKIPAACRGLSLEPLLGPVDLSVGHVLEVRPSRPICQAQNENLGKISWLIIGGESGDKARPCNVDWIRSLMEQGRAAGVATFVKQLGAKPLQITYSGNPAIKPENKRAFKSALILADKKGGDPAEWPADLRVQQWPEGF